VIHYPGSWPEGGPAGRGGWLLFVFVGLAYTVLALPFTLFQGWLPWLLDPVTWAEIADPTAHDLHPSWPAFVVFYLLVTVLLGFAAAVGLVLFARRSPEFPKYMISYYLGSFVLLLTVLTAEIEMWPYDFESHAQTGTDMIIAFLWVVLGVPYIARSKRVKNTFVKRATPAAASPAG
jgi:hypothetical protein